MGLCEFCMYTKMTQLPGVIRFGIFRMIDILITPGGAGSNYIQADCFEYGYLID